MSVHAFLLILTAGAAVLALWLVVRFPSLAPRDLRRAGVHAAAALAAGWLAAPLTGAVAGSALPLAAFVGMFGVFLPAMLYSFVAAAWLMKVCQGAVAGSGR